MKLTDAQNNVLALYGAKVRGSRGSITGRRQEVDVELPNGRRQFFALDLPIDIWIARLEDAKLRELRAHVLTGRVFAGPRDSLSDPNSFKGP